MSRYFDNKVAQQYAADSARVEATQKGFVKEPQHIKHWLVQNGESKLAQSMQDTSYVICKGGGNCFNSATYINGNELPSGGYWDLDGYHGLDGNVYK